MESFFFNITDRRYKTADIFRDKDEYIKRVDISNGVVFLDISLHVSKKLDFHIKNLDRMIMICVSKNGVLNINDNINTKTYSTKSSTISIYASSRQDINLKTKESEKSDIFILFLADFFLKRYLSSNKNEPIDFLYNKIQGETSLEHINTHPTDALSLYIIEKITDIKSSPNMNSIRCEHNVVEFLIHRLSLCDMLDEDIDAQEYCISKRAKDILLASFASPPSISTLAHLCATNESKLKKVFKKVYKSTIYNYIQKLRLEEANLLLKQQNLTIGEISKKIGYKHQGHFSKVFYKTYGIYPKDLLKR
jgi:AraC-like DNA-binding protein